MTIVDELVRKLKAAERKAKAAQRKYDEQHRIAQHFLADLQKSKNRCHEIETAISVLRNGMRCTTVEEARELETNVVVHLPRGGK